MSMLLITPLKWGRPLTKDILEVDKQGLCRQGLDEQNVL